MCIKKAICLNIIICLATIGLTTNSVNASDVNIRYRCNSQNETELDDEIPSEVKSRIEEIKKKNPAATITVTSSIERNVPSSTLTDEVGVQSTDSHWNPFRTYKKTKIRDWIVRSENAFPMEDIKKGKSASKALNHIIAYCGGQVLDKIVPFSSAGITAANYIAGNNYKYSADVGDKLQAAPKFTTTEKFTYVYIGNQPHLGTKSYCSRVESISWYLYSSKKHRQFTKTAFYSNVLCSPNYKSPDKKALQSYANGGHIDQVIRIKIKDAVFYLK